MALFMRFPIELLPHIERVDRIVRQRSLAFKSKLIRGCNRLIWRSVVTFDAAFARTLRRYGNIAYLFSGGKISWIQYFTKAYATG